MPRRRRRPFLSDLSLDPETLHGVLTVAIFAVAVILLLATFNLAGSFGISIDQALAGVFGWDRVILPFMLLAIGIREASPNRLSLSAGNYIGFLLFYFSLNPLVHAAQGLNPDSSQESLANAGGRIGALVADPFVGIFGSIGVIVVFTALFIVSLLLMFNTSLRRVVQVLTYILNLLIRLLKAILAPFKWMMKKRTSMAEERLRSSLAQPQKPAVQEEEEEDEEEAEEEEEEDEEAEEEEGDVVTKKAPPPKPKKKTPMVEIPVELLTKRDQKPTSGDIQHNQLVIQRTLETFGIPVEMADVAVGPTVTQFTLKPSEGVKLSRITALHNDLALALAAHPIRIEAPIPGKSLVGIEVPNQSVATVGLREMFESREWKDHREGLAFALGRDVSGKASLSDIGRMPHMLVAGATGSGKSVCLNTIIMSLLYANGPDDLKFIMVDPKRVELQVYNGIPHLVTPVITDTEKTVNALKWSLREMDRRFDVLSKFGARDIGTYNSRSQEKLPYIVVIIDELADLMVTASQDVEGPVVRLAQMARAVGIHLVLATQRPSTDVITGLIKANIPARFAFAVASSIDSRTILDATGAEKLLGRGDMLMQTSDMSSPRRVQGAFVSDDEISRVVGFLKSKYEPVDYDSSVVERPTSGGSGFSNAINDDSDPLIPEAKEEILRAGKASASLLQRRLKVGYARAARLLDLLEQEGFIGPGDGAKPREILKAEFTKGLDQIAAPNVDSAELEQVNRELPPLEGEEDAIEEE
jgi:S-DNA-T family DNA segregation ATPase FtsK/SpoIIIE